MMVQEDMKTRWLKTWIHWVEEGDDAELGRSTSDLIKQELTTLSGPSVRPQEGPSCSVRSGGI